MRDLSQPEQEVLAGALALKRASVLNAMSMAADDQEVGKLRALLAVYDLCVHLEKLVASPCRIVVQGEQ